MHATIDADRRLDDMLVDSFPASDPPSTWAGADTTPRVATIAPTAPDDADEQLAATVALATAAVAALVSAPFAAALVTAVIARSR